MNRLRQDDLLAIAIFHPDLARLPTLERALLLFAATAASAGLSSD